MIALSPWQVVVCVQNFIVDQLCQLSSCYTCTWITYHTIPVTVPFMLWRIRNWRFRTDSAVAGTQLWETERFSRRCCHTGYHFEWRLHGTARVGYQQTLSWGNEKQFFFARCFFHLFLQDWIVKSLNLKLLIYIYILIKASFSKRTSWMYVILKKKSMEYSEHKNRSIYRMLIIWFLFYHRIWKYAIF